MADLITDAELLAGWPAASGTADAERAALIAAASAAIEDYTRRTFALEAIVERRAGNGTPRLWLDRRPVVSVDSLEVNGEALDNTAGDAWTLADAASGELVRGDGRSDLRFAAGFPAGRGNVTVGYTAGYAEVPAPVKRAALILCRYLAAAPGLATVKREKIGDYEYEAAGTDAATAGRLPAPVEMLLRPYVQNELV